MMNTRMMKKWITLFLTALLLMGICAQACADSAQISIDGATYDLPCRLSAYLDNGWTIDSKDQEWYDTNGSYVNFTLNAVSTVPAGYAGSFMLTKNGHIIFTSIASTSVNKSAAHLVVSSMAFVGTSAPSVQFLGRDFSKINASTVGDMFEPISDSFEDCGAGEWYAWFEDSGIWIQFGTDSTGWYQINLGVSFAYDF